MAQRAEKSRPGHAHVNPLAQGQQQQQGQQQGQHGEIWIMPEL
jgi:hypothetical protein